MRKMYVLCVALLAAAGCVNAPAGPENGGDCLVSVVPSPDTADYTVASCIQHSQRAEIMRAAERRIRDSLHYLDIREKEVLDQMAALNEAVALLPRERHGRQLALEARLANIRRRRSAYQNLLQLSDGAQSFARARAGIAKDRTRTIMAGELP